MSSYRTLKTKSTSLLKERGSRFLGFAFKVNTVSEVQKHLNELKSDYADASHICYAYRLGLAGDQIGYSDAGEPANSAGLPIYRQILSANVFFVLVVVVRYFGGKKLGIPGLIENYGGCAAACLEETLIAEETEKVRFILIAPETEGYKAYQFAAKMKWHSFKPWGQSDHEFEVEIDAEEWTMVQNLISELQSFEWRSP